MLFFKKQYYVVEQLVAHQLGVEKCENDRSKQHKSFINYVDLQLLFLDYKDQCN